MSVEDWIAAFERLNSLFGATFYLFLGTEPLIMGQGLVDIVRALKERGLFYGFYSTSPEPLFSRWRDKLLEAGIDNWSAGIDTLPHLDYMDPITDKKVRQSIEGLQWMAERGVSTHAQTTIHKKNLHLVPEIMEWCQHNIPGVENALNFVEWRRSPEFDFFAPPEDMQDMLWDGSDEERAEVRRVMLEVLALSRVHGMLIQTPDEYLINAHLHYDKLDVHCRGVIGPSLDADGTLRLCGYNAGDKAAQWNVRELTEEKFNEFMDDWESDLAGCVGCHWSFVPLLEEDPRILDPTSGFLQDRWSLNTTTLKKRSSDGA